MRKRVGKSKKLALADVQVKLERKELGFQANDKDRAAFFAEYLDYAKTNKTAALLLSQRGSAAHVQSRRGIKASTINKQLVPFVIRISRFAKYESLCYNSLMRSAGGLKPQDVLVLLKMAASRNRSWRLIDLAQDLGLSLSEVSVALERAKRARLIDNAKKNIVWPSFLEFILHGLKYVYPAEPGAICRGIPTAHSAPPLSSEIVSEENDQYVWPSGNGTVRGQAIEPLYESVPLAASKDPELHQLLALVDALRVGRARERQLAAEELMRRLHG